MVVFALMFLYVSLGFIEQAGEILLSPEETHNLLLLRFHLLVTNGI